MDRRLASILALAVVPWSVVVAPGSTTLVFPLWFVDPATLHAMDLYSFTFAYTRGLPGFLLAWPVGVLLYVAAAANGVVGTVAGREDRRVTAALLVLVGLTQLTMALGFARRAGTVALPVGTVACWTVAWWFDAGALRGLVGPSSA